MNQQIYFHADDYAIALEASKNIVNCYYDGVLNSISIMPNSECLPESKALLNPIIDKISLSIHLNLSEGYCCTDKSQVPLLINKDGSFNCSFGKLLILSYIPIIKTEYESEIYHELRTQILKTMETFNINNIRLDSHVHYHMIPIVFDSLIKIIKNEKINVTYIRCPNEPIIPFLKNLELKNYFSINFVKVITLKLLALRNGRIIKKIVSDYKPTIFFGVLLTGKMLHDAVNKVLPTIIKYAKDRNSDLEIVFHPGGVTNKNELNRITNKNDIMFLQNSNRMEEAKTLMGLKKG